MTFPDPRLSSGTKVVRIKLLKRMPSLVYMMMSSIESKIIKASGTLYAS